MASIETIQVARQVAAQPAEVYRAFTHPVALREWFCDRAHLDTREGGVFFAWWRGGQFASGQYTGLEPDRQIALAWRGPSDAHDAQVVVTLAAADGGTHVSVADSGTDRGEFWQRSLEVLQSVLETGEDIRFTRRPMLGISGGYEITPEVAAKEGLPVTQGVRIYGAVEGMGAAKAGLQKDDIIAGMDGAVVNDFNSLTAILQHRRAGDTVEVEFYRDGQQHTAPMELSRRPLPDVPADPAALAQRVREQFDEANAELASILDGVSDAQASHHPAEGEWSVKETLAHLVAEMRDQHNAIAALVWGDELNVFADNEPTRVQAMAAVYGTAGALFEELKRAEAVTVAMLANLPPEFVARKASYQRTGLALLQTFHIRDHLDQIKAAIASEG